jgi:hypothetical protein
VGVSAGFDTYLEDRGGRLKIEDYQKIGKAIREGRRRDAEGGGSQSWKGISP